MKQIGTESITLYPVGFVRNNIKKPVLTAGEKGLELDEEFRAHRERFRQHQQEVSKIIIDEQIADILEGIEEYSHLQILYWPHLAPEKSRSLTKVHPMGRKEFPLVGLFGTCSPARPNPVLVTLVKLIERQGNVLQVSGLDAVDGSPVLDIKPYVREMHVMDDVRIPGWMQQIVDEISTGNN